MSSQYLVNRYWFLVGNYDAWIGRLNDPPVTVERRESAYQRVYFVGASLNRFYRNHWPK